MPISGMVSHDSIAGNRWGTGSRSWRERRWERISDSSSLTRAGDQVIQGGQRSRLLRLTFILYITTLTTDAIRKVAELPTSTVGVVYIITALIYIVIIPATSGQRRTASRATPRTLPLWLFMLSFWCLAVALVQHTPPEMALLGWVSYVFFVPLFYVGAELAADDHLTARAFQAVVISGGIIGIGAVASAILGQSAPAILQPIVPAAGIHSFTTSENIYLSPSIFATSEEASEQLLIALFAWAALPYLAYSRLRPKPWMFLGMLIISGLIVAARRADIDVAIAGIIMALVLGRVRAPAWSRRFIRRATAKAPGGLGTAAFLTIVGSTIFLIFLGQARLASFLVSGSPGSRISYMFSLPNTGSLVGQGPGTSTQGVAVVGAAPLEGGELQGSLASYVLDGRTFITGEGGLTKTWIELGIIGVALYTAIFCAVLTPVVKSLRRLDSAGVALTMLTIALGVVFLKGHQSLDDPLIQPLFWLGVGGIWGRMRAVAPIEQP